MFEELGLHPGGNYITRIKNQDQRRILNAEKAIEEI